MGIKSLIFAQMKLFITEIHYLCIWLEVTLSKTSEIKGALCYSCKCEA